MLLVDTKPTIEYNDGRNPVFFMKKHSVLLRTQVEVASACGVPIRKITAALGVAKSTQSCWLKMGWSARQKQYSKRWAKRNPEAISRMNKRHREKYPEKMKEYNHRNYRRGYLRNPEYYIEKSASRRRNIWKIPLTLRERRQIQAMLREARRLSRETGEPYEVDHIWPVSRGGWHHPANMRIITRKENRRKLNQLPTLEEMLRNTITEEIP